MSVHQLKDGRWICKFPDPADRSKSKRKYFGRGALAESKARAHDESLGLSRTKPRQETGPTFIEISGEYIANMAASGRDTYRTKNTLHNNIFPAIGNTPASSLTHPDLDAYVAARLRHVKSCTVRHEIQVIQAIMNWSVRRRPPLIPLNPLRGYEPPKNDYAIIYPPTMQELTRIMQEAPALLKRYITIAFYTGLRPGASELLRLKWEDVLWTRNAIRVTSANKGGIAAREVPLHPAFRSELESWHRMDGSPGAGWIISFKGRAIRQPGRTWHRTLIRAGITRRIRLYDLRHLFVTAAIEAGNDYKTLSEIVGSSPETLRKHYQHVSSAARVRLIETMPALVTFGNDLPVTGNQTTR